MKSAGHMDHSQIPIYTDAEVSGAGEVRVKPRINVHTYINNYMQYIYIYSVYAVLGCFQPTW